MLAALPRLERIAHRGASRERLENTLAAFLLALERGADGIELDVHVTADGVPVVHHDETLAGQQIAQLPWERVGSLVLEDDNRVPRLADVLNAVANRAAVYIELKGREIERGVVPLVQRLGHRFALHSFDHEAVARVGALAPEVPRGVLLERGLADPQKALTNACARVKPRDVWPHHSLVDRAFMATASQLGVRVIAWTVNDAADARRLAQLGVAGICTDDVRLIESE